MLFESSNDRCLQSIASAETKILSQLVNQHQQILVANSTLNTQVAEVVKDQHDATAEIRRQIQEHAESKLWKILYIVIPVLLGFFVWVLQLRTNERIDSESKKLAARLALTEEFYKKKLGVYEDVDRQMVIIVGALNDLRLDPNSGEQRAGAADSVRKLSEISKMNDLYISKPITEAISDVSYAAVGCLQGGGKPPTGMQPLQNKVGQAEQLMKGELQGQLGSLD